MRLLLPLSFLFPAAWLATAGEPKDRYLWLEPRGRERIGRPRCFDRRSPYFNSFHKCV